MKKKKRRRDLVELVPEPFDPRRRWRIVPYPRIKNRRVMLPAKAEDVLEITPLIKGRCSKGYYVRGRAAAELLDQHLSNIRWLRVKEVISTFIVKHTEPGVAIMVPANTYAVDESRWTELLNCCFTKVKKFRFERLVEEAIKQVERRLIKRSKRLAAQAAKAAEQTKQRMRKAA